MDGHFISAAGTFFVMHKLATLEMHASCTYGNAPDVDVLVSSADGSKSIAIQVKTAKYAKRFRGRGNEKHLHHLEWNLGKNAAQKNHDGLYFAFVDLNDCEEVTEVYIIPSTFVFNFCRDWVDDVAWVRFHPTIEGVKQFKDNWGLLENMLYKQAN